MVTVDDRLGSRDLLDPLRYIGVPAKSGRLDYGDVEMIGKGPGDRPVLVGVEYKSLNDCLTSMRDNRLYEQLRGMRANYEYRVLLVYGIFRPDEDGRLTQLRGRVFTLAGHGKGMSYAEFQGRLLSIRIRPETSADVVVVATPKEAAWYVKALYNWWCCSEWESHRSTLGLQDAKISDYTPFEPTSRIPLRQYVASTLPGIGSKKALAAREKFASTRDMILATPEQWQEIEGVGPVTAERIVQKIDSE